MDNKMQLANLDNNRTKLVNYLFNNNEELYEPFDKDVPVQLPDTFDNMFDYPHESTLRQLKQSVCNKKKLFTTIYNIIIGKTRDNFNNIYRAVHPAWLLLFYKELQKKKYKYCPILDLDTGKYGNLMEIKHEDIKNKLKAQYNQSFKVYYSLINDAELLYLIDSDDIMKKLYLNLVVEQYVEPTNTSRGKYIDMVYKFSDENTLSVEINEFHHDKIQDDIRKRQIFARSLNKVIYFYIEDGYDSIKKELFGELAKCLYKIDEKVGINIHMVKINDFDFSSTMIFTLIKYLLDANNLFLTDFIKMATKNFMWKNMNSCVSKMIRREILTRVHFNNVEDPMTLLDDNKILKSDITATLNSAGVARILNSPRKKDFNGVDEVSVMYGKFIECYYDMLKDLLGNSREEMQMLHEQYKLDIGLKDMLIACTNIGLEYFQQMCVDTGMTHHPLLPYAIESKNSKINFIDIAHRFGENSEIYIKLSESSESRQVLRGYRWLGDDEIMAIRDKYKNNVKDNYSDSDSDEEEL